MGESKRLLSNIFITGTPGVGKSTISKELCRVLNGNVTGGEYKVLEVSKLIVDEKLYDEWDDERDCSVMSEDRVHDYLEDLLTDDNGGYIVDFHSAAPVDCDWFDLVVQLRADTSSVYDRLSDRGYKNEKVVENVDCEIFNEIGTELQECFDEVNKTWNPQACQDHTQLELQNDTQQQCQENIQTILKALHQIKFQ